MTAWILLLSTRFRMPRRLPPNASADTHIHREQAALELERASESPCMGSREREGERECVSEGVSAKRGPRERRTAKGRSATVRRVLVHVCAGESEGASDLICHTRIRAAGMQGAKEHSGKGSEGKEDEEPDDGVSGRA